MERSHERLSQQGDESSAPFQFKMKLDEDVGGAIEDLIMYSRLGFVNDALDVINEVLWKHLLFFPALAETSLFLLEQDNIPRLQSVLALLRKRVMDYRETFTNNEKAFVRLLDEITLPLDGSSHEKLVDLPDWRKNRLLSMCSNFKLDQGSKTPTEVRI